MLLFIPVYFTKRRVCLSVCSINGEAYVVPKREKTDVSVVNANVYKSTKMVDVCVTSVGDGSLRVEQKQA